LFKEGKEKTCIEENAEKQKPKTAEDEDLDVGLNQNQIHVIHQVGSFRRKMK
jgi:hypothetical protein